MKFAACASLAAWGLALAGLWASPAAAQGTFVPGTGTSTNCNIGTNGSAVASKVCSVDDVSVTMTAWGFTGANGSTATLNGTARTGFTQGLLADWDTSGIGAYTGNRESTTGGQHGFDNLTTGCGTTQPAANTTTNGNNSGCGGSIEALLLSFNNSVNLTSVGIGWRNGDADLMVWAWTGGPGGPDMNSQTAAGSTNFLTSGTCASSPVANGGQAASTACTAAALAGWTLVSSLNFGSTGSLSTGTPGANTFSSYFLITTYFGAASGDLSAGNDAFKLNAFTFGGCSGGNCQRQTPEPGALSLAVLALAGMGAARRVSRRRTA